MTHEEKMRIAKMMAREIGQLEQDGNIEGMKALKRIAWEMGIEFGCKSNCEIKDAYYPCIIDDERVS